MNKQKEPKLRFPGFAGEWEEKRLGDVAPLQRGFDLPSTQLEKGNYPVVYSNGVLNRHKECKAKAPGLVTGRSGTIGKIHYIEEDYWPHNTTLWVTNFYGNNPKFVFYMYNQIRIEQFSTGSGVPTLNRNNVHSHIVAIPTLSEQKMIAEFLSDIDTKIEKLSRKKELTEQYKKGAMQKIFSQKSRFKDENGKNYPDWEEKSLGDLLEYEQPTKYIVDSTEYNDKLQIPVLTAGKTFILGYTDEDYGVFRSLPVIIFDDFTTANHYVDFQFKVKSSAMKILKLKNKTNNLKFIYESMQKIDFPIGEHKRYWISEYQEFSVDMPRPEEQKKIANFLIDLDTRIEHIDKELVTLKEFKKGLLQGMFV